MKKEGGGVAWHGAIVLTKDLEVKARGQFLSVNMIYLQSGLFPRVQASLTLFLLKHRTFSISPYNFIVFDPLKFRGALYVIML